MRRALRMGCVASNGWPHQDFHRHYILGERLGGNNSGQILVAVPMRGNYNHAVRVVDTQPHGKSVPDESALAAVRQQERLWMQLGRHPNCVELLQVFVGVGGRYLVMERCLESVRDRLGALVNADDQTLGRLLREMLLGLAHLHRRRVMHRNLKPRKFLVGPDGLALKMCGFGQAAVLPSGCRSLPGSFGTVGYMSPEMIGGRGHSPSADLWSIGTVAYLLLYGELPYVPEGASPATAQFAALHGVPAPKFTHWRDRTRRSTKAEDFCRVLLEHRPGSRGTAEQHLRHLFIESAEGTAGQQAQPLPEDSREEAMRCAPAAAANLPTGRSGQVK